MMLSSDDETVLHSDFTEDVLGGGSDPVCS